MTIKRQWPRDFNSQIVKIITEGSLCKSCLDRIAPPIHEYRVTQEIFFKSLKTALLTENFMYFTPDGVSNMPTDVVLCKIGNKLWEAIKVNSDELQ